MIAYNNIVYAGCLDGRVYALDAQNGNKVEEFDLGSPVASSPVLVGKTIFIAAEDGKIYSLDTGNNKIKQLAVIDTKDPASAPLAATDEIVYIHTPNLTIHRIDIETGAKLMPIPLKRD